VTELQLWHDSHKSIFREPFGAVPCGTEITLRLAMQGNGCPKVSGVWLCIARDGEAPVDICMKQVEETEGDNIYEVSWSALEKPGLYWYFFRVACGKQLFYYGNNTHKLGGVGEAYSDVPPAYQITVHRPGIETPDWLKDGVMYQIFVDRFCNGLPDGQVLHPKPDSLLHANWNSTPLYIRDPETKRVIRWDFYGGNLHGVMEKLPYLKKLGITVIYLNPIFEAPSNHKYDTGDYHKIDPMFGDNDLFASLCAEARRLGIRIVLDGVFNHTGSDSLYFNKEGNYTSIGAYQARESPYYDWYHFTRYPDEYECWWGIDVLPNVDEMTPSYQEFIIHGKNSVLRQWHHLGASGWRLDVADELPSAFIESFRSVMKEIDSEAALIGEVWEDASNKISYDERRRYLLGYELDSVMNYPFRRAVLEFLLGRIDSMAVHQALMSLYENYPRPYFYSLMNLIGSHDVPRVLTALQEEVPASVSSEKERRALAVKRLKLAVLWQMTFPGMPSVYYGDEAGMEGGADPMNRGPYPWGTEDKALLTWYHKAIGWRRSFAALRTGEWISFSPTPDVYGYIRRIAGEKDVFGRKEKDCTAVILLNRSTEKEFEVKLEVQDEFRFHDITENRKIVEIKDRKLCVTLAPLEGQLLIALS
jgi:cyclomaltodextrinase